jgi:hypothetical protein
VADEARAPRRRPRERANLAAAGSSSGATPETTAGQMTLTSAERVPQKQTGSADILRALAQATLLVRRPCVEVFDLLDCPQ